MDNLDRQSSAHESVEDNVLNLDDHAQNDDEVKANGSYLNENHEFDATRIENTDDLADDGELNDQKGVEGIENSKNSKHLSPKSPPVASPTLTKGFGLRKWRRIKRDVVKDSSPNADSSKVLKRGFSISGNQNKPRNSKQASENVQNSEGSVGSTNAMRNVGVVDGLDIPGPDLESRFTTTPAFAAGEDSENSEDRSSKSSTAASAPPRMRHDLPSFFGGQGGGYEVYLHEKSKIKNSSGKNAVTSAQRVQQGKGRVESSKKPRGDRVKIEKENSHSSIESDSRSNFVFMQGAGSVTSNGNPIEKSMFYDGENSDDAHTGEPQFGTGKNNEEDDVYQDDLADNASWEDKNSENHRSSNGQDPLLDSMLTLQSVQEALESELKKLGEIGKVGITSANTASADQGIHESIAAEHFVPQNVGQSNIMEPQVSSLIGNIKHLESRLKEAEDMLKLKESMVAELKTSLTKSPAEESTNTSDLPHEKSGELENELEGIFKQKIEAEIEYLTLMKAMQKLRVAAGDPVTIFEQQETLASEQAQMLNKLGEAEKKGELLMKQAEEVEKYRGDILGTEEVLKMQRRVCKVTLCFLMQIVLLMLVFLLLVMQLSPQTGVVVPT